MKHLFLVTIRTFMVIATSKNWKLHQMNVHNALLQGNLDEKVYIKLPLGFTSTYTTMVCRLRKSLYNLRQAPWCWFTKLVSSLKGMFSSVLYSDYSLFTYTKRTIRLNVLLYVDDLIIFCNDSFVVKIFKAYLSKCFHMKDFGVLKYFLGIEVARSTPSVFMPEKICSRYHIRN